MEVKFAIAIEAGSETSAFGVVVPDLPGCFSAGDTVEEAFDNAREAIEAYCEAIAEKGEDLPMPKGMAEWQKDKEYRGWTWGIVEVPVEKLFGPAEKINITVPAMTLRHIDAYATSAGETRSGFLVRAAQQTMGALGGPHSARAVAERAEEIEGARRRRRG